MSLRFGSVRDIVSAKRAEIKGLQDKINELLKEECDGVEKCELRSNEAACESCSLKKQCREGSAEIFAKVGEMEAEQDRIQLKIKYLHLELLLSRHKDAEIQCNDLELFS